MGQEIIYEWVAEGENTEISVTPIADVNYITSGTIDLVNGRGIVYNYYAGKSVILSRNQDNTTNFGHLYVYTPNTIEGVSFEIRSTNTADNGTICYTILE